MSGVESPILLDSGARALKDTETFDVVTAGKKNLVLVTDVTAIGNGHSFVDGAAITLPFTVDATHNQFEYNELEFVVANGVYTTLASLAAAINASIEAVGPTTFSSLVTAAASPAVAGALRFTDVGTGVNATAFGTAATHNILVTGLGLTDTAAINATSAAGADGAFSQTVSILGVDPLSGKTWTILAAAAVSTVSTQVLQVSDHIAAVANLAANAILPQTIRISITHTTNNSLTRTIALQLV